MISNDNFNKVLKESGLSMYGLAKYSGVPYTTINEIHNNKIDINRCESGTVFKLAACINASPEEIMNKIMYLDGIKGKYKGIEYVWSTSDTSKLIFEYKGEEVVLDTEKQYNVKGRNRYYNMAAELMIKDYMEKMEWEEEAEKCIKGLKNER